MSESDDPVGSAAEEAAKLLGAVAEWARDADAHLANGEDCRYCPICRAVQVFRSASPEVREHVTSAATSLAQAAAALLATAVPEQRGSGVEHIDLTDDWPDADADAEANEAPE